MSEPHAQDLLAEVWAECAEIFPVSAGDQKIWLLDALIRVLRDVPWLTSCFDASLAGQLRELRRVAWANATEVERAAQLEEKGGNFGVADAMIGTGREEQPCGIQTFRGLFWLTLQFLYQEGHRYHTLAEDVASALRSIAKRPGNKADQVLAPILRELERVNSLGEAVDALQPLDECKHNTLCRAWNRWWGPTLQRLIDKTAPTNPAESPQPPGPIVPTKGKGQLRGGLDARPEIHPLPPSARPRDWLPDEPLDEAAEPPAVVLVPGYGTGTLSRKQAEYRARQAIWGRNYLLLPDHAEALLPDIYQAVVQSLAFRLEASAPGAETSTGYLGCLLKAITGRVTKGLMALGIEAPPADGKIQHLYLDLAAGELCFPPYWKVQAVGSHGDNGNLHGEGWKRALTNDAPTGYFRPSPTQLNGLFPVSDRITLPLLAPLRRVLRKHRDALGEFVSLAESELDRRMANAASDVARELDVPLRVANLRRTLGTLVMEQSGDLAMAQLVCGDSFGRPSAQQHYYAPRRKDIAAVYLKVLAPCFNAADTPRLKREGTRVGSELLLRPATAKKLARTSLQAATVADPDLVDRSGVIARHAGIVDHCVRMLVATTGHRWSESIFDLTLCDLDLDIGMALYADKRYDVAHDPRMVGLPKIVCGQLSAYVDHLVDLANGLPTIEEKVRRVLRGEAPLLFDLEESDSGYDCARPTLQGLLARGPSEWHVLPGNWGRTYFRTRALEMGCPAFLVACQLGHYDAVGYPFSNQSPTEPSDVVIRLRPWLDRAAATQGWMIVNVESRSSANETRSKSSLDVCPCLPLKDWREELARAQRRAHDAHNAWIKSLHANPKRAREAAEEAVLGNDTLVEAGVVAAYRDETSAGSVAPLNELDLYRVRQELLVGCGDDTGAALRRVRALRHVLKVVAQRAGQPAPSVTLPIAVRKPLDNAFFASACMALSQVRLLRRHVRERAEVKRPDRSFVKQVARTAEALMLFGGIDDVKLLIALLEARGEAKPSAKVIDLMLVPVADKQVIGLRHLAALALANLAQQFPEETIPPRDVIEKGVAELLPSWACSHRTRGLLTRLCSTVAVANRFEYSPAARFATDPDCGSMSAPIQEQLALVDQDPVGPKCPVEPLPSRGNVEKDVHHSVSAHPQSAHRQYQTLCKMIPVLGRNWISPLTGRVIKAAAVGLDARRPDVVAELENWMTQSDSGKGNVLWPLVRMLAEWLCGELARKKLNGKYLRYNSIETYLTRFGRSLVQELGELEPEFWTDRVMEDAYGYALEASTDAKHKVAVSLLSFHHFLEERIDVPEVDLAPLYAELSRQERHVDTALVLPIERARAFSTLQQDAWSNDQMPPGATRIARQADAIAPFLGYGGARLSEPLGMQLRDIGWRPGGGLWARIRSNRHRSLKTRAATRVVVLGPVVDAEHVQRTRQWARDVGKHAGSRRTESVYLVSGLDGRDDVGERRAVARKMREVLAGATGRRRERLHRLRHLVATERIMRTVLSTQDAKWIGMASLPVHERALQPRDLHVIAVPLGHAHWMTTIQWYLHLPWVLQSRAAARLREQYFDRRTVAATLGLTPYALDDLLRGAKGADRVRVWFDHVRPGRIRPAAAANDVMSSNTVAVWKWSAVDTGRLVERAGKAKDLMAVLDLMGAPPSWAAPMEKQAARWERKLGLRLLPAYIGPRRRSCPARAIRRLADDSVLEKLWARVDAGTPAERKILRTIVADCYTYLDPASRQELVLSSECAVDLKKVLVSLGIADRDIVQIPEPGDLVRMEIQRRTKSGKTHGYRGLGLKRVLAVAGLALDFQSSWASGVSANGNCAWTLLISPVPQP